MAAEEPALDSVVAKTETGSTHLRLVHRPDPATDAIAAPFAQAKRATIALDTQMDAWRLEVWGDSPRALGLWSIVDFDDFSAATYTLVLGLIENVGLTDAGRDSWTLVSDTWTADVVALRSRTSGDR